MTDWNKLKREVAGCSFIEAAYIVGQLKREPDTPANEEEIEKNTLVSAVSSLKRQGKSIREIASSTGASKSEVHRILKGLS